MAVITAIPTQEGIGMLYWEMKQKDIIGLLKPLFDQGKLEIKSDGKLHLIARIAEDLPWIYPNPPEDRNCLIYQIIFFKLFKLIHSRCLKCWKVVVRPRTVVELFGLLELQEDIVAKDKNIKCKCGIENRFGVPFSYGGYFYVDSLEEGLILKKFLIREINNPDIKVILKRGCTEFEHAFGSSDSWVAKPYQKDLEALIDEYLEYDDTSINTRMDIVKIHTKVKWIEWAFAHGDETYKLFTGGNPLYPEVKTYDEND